MSDLLICDALCCTYKWHAGDAPRKNIDVMKKVSDKLRSTATPAATMDVSDDEGQAASASAKKKKKDKKKTKKKREKDRN